MKLLILSLFIVAVSAYKMEEMLEYVDTEAENIQLPLHGPLIPEEDFDDDKSRCCTPLQWEGYGTGHGVAKKHSHRPSRPTAFSEFYHLHYDYTGRRFAAQEFLATSGGRRLNFTMIVNFKSKTGYVIYKGTHCKTFSLKNTMQKFCIPSNASYISSPYIGAASEKLSMKVFGGKFRTKRMIGGYIISVTPKLCIPISEAFGIKSRRGAGANGLSYFNITPGIKSAKVFTPPKFCSQYADVEEDEVFDNHSDLGQLIHEKFVHGL